LGEKNILAYFKSPEEAEGVILKLRALRVVDLSIDRFSRYNSEGSLTGVPGLALDSDLSHPSVNILAASDPSNSGMSNGGQGGPTGRDILLTVVVDESSHHQAMRIIEEAGGLI
jgi:hypothetical protein